MKLIPIIFLSVFLLASCGSTNTPVTLQPKIESNTVDIGNKTITTISGSYVQSIR